MLETLPKSQITRVIIITIIGLAVALSLFALVRTTPEEHKSAKLKSVSDLGEPNDMMSGGLGGIRERDSEAEEALKNIREEFERQTNKKYESIDIIQYRHQVVAGMNYFIKAKAKPVDGPEEIVHFRIYRDLKKNFELTAYQLNKTLEEEIKHFEKSE